MDLPLSPRIAARILFQPLAEREASRLLVLETDVFAEVDYAADAQGLSYYCYYLPPGSIDWLESPEADNLLDALDNLREALRQYAREHFFSLS